MQNAWAGIASYLGHSTSIAAAQENKVSNSDHHAHHEHDLHISKTAEHSNTPNDSAYASVSVDNDCGVCHIACCMAVLPQDSTLLPLSILSAQQPHHGAFTLSDIASAIERPVWPLIL